MANIYNFTDTWNAGLTTYSAIKCSVTDTASAADSALIDILVGGTSMFRVQKDGEISTSHYYSAIQKWAKGSDIASASALTIPTNGNFFDVTGTTAITSISAVQVGTRILLQFDGILTLTHHATDLKLPGGANITTAAGDFAEFVEYASGDWALINYTTAAAVYLANLVEDTTPQLGGNLDVNSHGITFPGGTVTDTTGADTLLVSGTAGTSGDLAVWNVDGDLVDGPTPPAGTIVGTSDSQTLTNKTLTTPTLTLKSSSGAAPTAQGDIQQDTDDDAIVIGDGSATKKVAFNDETHGQHTIWANSGAFVRPTTNGAAYSTEELATNDIGIAYYAFDASTEEALFLHWQAPKSYNGGTIIVQPIWKHPSTTTNFGVVWGISGRAYADGNALDQAMGTEQTSTDTGGTTGSLYIAPEASAVTLAGSPAGEQFVIIKIARKVANGSDTMAVDAHLLGVKIHYTTNASTDD